MLDYRDFFPDRMEKGTLLKRERWEPFEEAVRKANQWVEGTGVRVLNVETVVLPNLWDAGEEGTEDASLNTAGNFPSTWHQIVRIWYEKD